MPQIPVKSKENSYARMFPAPQPSLTQRIRVYTETLSPNNARSNTHKSYQYDCMNMNWTRDMITQMLIWTRKRPSGFNLTQKSTWLRVQEIIFPRGEHNNELVIQHQMISSENRNNNIIRWRNLYVGVYTSVQKEAGLPWLSTKHGILRSDWVPHQALRLDKATQYEE